MDETRRLDDAVHDLQSVIIPDDILVDVVGDVAATHRRLGAWLRDQKAELGPGTVGERWENKPQGRSCDRSYNTNGLLAAFADALPGAQTAPGALQRLLERDVVRLTWRWTELQNEADREDVTLVIAKHEIADGAVDKKGRSVLVGEVWSDNNPKLVPVEDGEVIT